MVTRILLKAVLTSSCLIFNCNSIVFGQDAKVEVSNVRRVFHNGEHNAFTDLVKFHNRYYLTFRSCPDGHMVHSTATTIVLASDDLQTWNQVHRFGVPLRDTRDPHFLVFRDRLFVYTGTWYGGEQTIDPKDYDLNLHLGYAAWSDDGTTWNSPVMLEGTFGHYVWRAAVGKEDGKTERAYLCGRRKRLFDVRSKGEGPEVESAMLESDDGLTWKTRTLFQEVEGDETAFQFNADGSILAIGRRGRGVAQLLQSKPPYKTWDRRDLDRQVGGPLLAKWNDDWIVGGRKTIGESGPKTSLYWLGKEGELREFAELPSGGDCSYPGFLQLGPNQGVVSWYSSHEKDDSGKTITAIYMADLKLVK